MTTVEQTIGAPLTRADGPQKVTGAARYAYEFPIPDITYVWPVQSTIARGRVTEVDPSAALALPGVLAVLDSGNAPRLNADAEVGADLFVLQSPEVAYHGQIVAAVVATSLESAREAAAAVALSYAPEPHDVVLRADHEAVYVPERVTDGSPGFVERGDVERALAAAAVRTDATYTTPVEHVSPMEPHATIAAWEEDRLTLHEASQGPHMAAQVMAGLFGLDPGEVEVVAEHIGGGFGAKGIPRSPAVLAALAARVVRRPVKIALTRQQMFALVPHRAPTIQRIRLGAERDGRLTAIDHQSVQPRSRIVEFADQTTSSTRMMYAAPDVRTTVKLAPLDIMTPAWFRAPGHTPGMFALESAVDELATELGMDPVELRIRNEPELDPDTGKAFSSRGLVACLREGAARFGWERRDPAPGVRREGRWLVGTGMAASHHPDYTRPSTATARAEPDGSFVVRIGAVDIGTGARTALAQVAADALGVPLTRLRLEIGRASLGMAPFAGGSMGTSSWGWAVHKACRALLEEVRGYAGVVPDGGLEVVADTTEDVQTRAELSRHTFGAQFAQVRVDGDTGEIRVDRMLGVFAAGRILNPTTARSQFLGAMTMGLSMALLEVGEVDPVFGDFANHDFAGYHIAANADVPKLEAHWLDERDDRLNPVGAKGIGELGIVGSAAAIANAFHHATGVRVRDLPIRIERSREALRTMRDRAGKRGSGVR
ncbi:xanthine dehydrogenase family protein molybdopterin-binding subunit [Streptomyces sp. ME19-01-6]|uniref:xanthine dehydrogenase family protein molybdopterin-binding subunit n=1 Tax=Streptomyces sp. ME19-01-6 TaxID=3028686 RepID=UPI0029BCF193|nr:xanthine dehydrogenase family protein molybdopterin-binding subunit [Streptomyces sp. ME19-01-6]MDX3232214.1 xanthine dehydrogenase family protein molybdopterin-binding subunit [Streptomyces sp. ME19-01-6]